MPREPHAAGVAIERNLVASAGPSVQAYAGQAGWAQQATDVYEVMATDFRRDVSATIFLDPTYTFPCLLHWSFVSTGSTTFETLMRELDSGLSGGLPQYYGQKQRANQPLWRGYELAAGGALMNIQDHLDKLLDKINEPSEEGGESEEQA